MELPWAGIRKQLAITTTEEQQVAERRAAQLVRVCRGSRVVQL
jgi:hypothetical protein